MQCEEDVRILKRTNSRTGWREFLVFLLHDENSESQNFDSFLVLSLIFLSTLFSQIPNRNLWMFFCLSCLFLLSVEL